MTDKYQSYIGLDATVLDAILRGTESNRSATNIGNQPGIAETEILRVHEIVKLTEFLRTQSLSPALG